MLKVIRGPRLPTVSERSHDPATAQEIKVTCKACGQSAHGKIPWKPTAAQRHAIVHDMVEIHRKQCTAGQIEDGRTYEIWYPRK